MAKKLLVLVAVLTLAAGGYWIYQSNQKDTASTTSSTQTSTTPAGPPETPSEDTPSSTNQAGQYIDYSDDVIAKTNGTKVLFFHAPWCPQCRQLENSIKSGQIPSGVSIIKVDYDSNQSLRKKYGVTIQTTLVKVDDQGNLVKKYVAYDSPSLESVKSNLL